MAKGLSRRARPGSPASSLLEKCCRNHGTPVRSLGSGVVARQGVIEGGPSLRAQTLAHHHLDEASEAADALQQLLGVALVDDEGVHALSRHSGGEDAPARRAGHVRVLALRVYHVGGDASASDP